MTTVAEPPQVKASVIGQPLRNVEWEAKTSGHAVYAGDVTPPGMLYARILRSPHPHARILGIDVSALTSMRSVAAVVTAQDLPERQYIHHGGPLSDRGVLARGVVRFVGEEVVGVAAETPQDAADALTRIRVDYAPLPAVFTPGEAVAPGAPALHEGGNVPVRHRRRWGDDPSLDGAGLVTVEGAYRFGRQTHACMETNTVTAWWHPESEILDIWISTQSPYLVRKELSHVLDLRTDQIHVHEVAVGGGFGSKSKISEYEAIACALSIKAARPVRLALTREEEFTTAKCRHSFDISMKTTVSPDGLILRREVDMTVDNGAYNHSGPSVMGNAGQVMGSLYRVPSVALDAQLVYTNKQPGGQFRGYGGPQAVFAIESQMDELADRLNVDPVELRMANANQAGDTTLNGWRLDSVRLLECLEAAREAIGWQGRHALRHEGRGVGFACAIHVSGANIYEDADKSSATIEVDADGGVLLRFGAADAGTWQNTIITQVAAHELGVEPAAIRLLTMETEETPKELGSWSSRGTYMSGHSVGETARAVAGLLLAAGAEHLGAAPDDVTLRGGSVSDGVREVSFAELVRERFDGRLVCTREIVLDNVEVINRETGVANISGAYSFAVHAAQVHVDEGTGRIQVERYVAVHDSGRIVNPTAARSQVVGGVVMGLGLALGEELLYEGGQSMTRSYIQYPLPRAADVPDIEVVFVEFDDPHGPYGAKAIGEIVLLPPGAAVANAVADASGLRIRQLPLTPDRVRAAVRERDGARRRSYRIGARPHRWQIAVMRAWYPRGLHRALHRWGTRWGRPVPPAPIEALRAPDSERALVEALAEPGTQVIAGGTDLVPARRQGLAQPRVLVDLGTVASLGFIEQADGEVSIGAGVHLTRLAEWGHEHLPVLGSAVDAIATEQIRVMATVGGNLCQTNRCWFLRNDFMCYKRGGVSCPCYAVNGDHRFYHAAIGAHRCQSVTPSDLATVLSALDAWVEIAGSRGRRLCEVIDFYRGPGEVRLRPGEFVRSVRFRPDRFHGMDYRKLNRSSGDFAVVSVATAVRLTPDGGIEDARVVLGAMAPTPYRAKDTERLLIGRPAADVDPASVAAAWVRRAHPLRDNEWKVDVAATMVQRSLETSLDSARRGRESR
jgi:CO/xanthine dehydrogenase Mo-binding subunit/CO/xanthine dehydrogenase FAD-binding subunit